MSQKDRMELVGHYTDTPDLTPYGKALERIVALEAELAKVREELAECQMLESTVAGMHRETLASLAVMKAERDAAKETLQAIQDTAMEF